MAHKKGKPRAGGTGGSEVIWSGDLKHSESIAATQQIQALHLSRRCAISVAMAMVIAPFAFDGGAHD